MPNQAASEQIVKIHFGETLINAPHYLTPVFFNKEVLNKYYSNPDKYSVFDGYITCGGLWSLRIDNNHLQYVMVFLGDLGHLNYKEQLYWKSFNVCHSGGISRVAWDRGFQGKFTDPDTPDLYFKMKYQHFQEMWYKKYAWYLFKPLSSKDEHHFKSLHLPATDNQKEFDEQVLSLTKIIIDSLNEEKISEDIVIQKPNPRGIDKFESFLVANGLDSTGMIEYLRNLQSLRSVSVAHRKSDKNKNYAAVKDYFKFENKSLSKVFTDILIKAIWIFNTLEKYLID